MSSWLQLVSKSSKKVKDVKTVSLTSGSTETYTILGDAYIQNNSTNEISIVGKDGTSKYVIRGLGETDLVTGDITINNSSGSTVSINFLYVADPTEVI